MSGQISRPAPQVTHSFDGQVAILNTTFDLRMQLRNILQGLSDELSKANKGPTQVVADIKFRIGGLEATQHVYTVQISEPGFDLEDFARQVPNSNENVSNASLSAKRQRSSAGPHQTNGQQTTPSQSSARPESRDTDLELVEVRPFKKPRTEPSTSIPSHGKDPDPGFRDITSRPNGDGSDKLDELFTFIKEWRTEWIRQGGWLFDNITKMNASTETNKSSVVERLGAVQDVLGNSMNSVAASTMAELGKINEMLPWLEHCRKTAADKVQAREERWRSSSANFHDQARRERETAEKRIEKKLEDQRDLLVKLAQANGIDIDEMRGDNAGSPERSREASLGAQLTRELNMEAAKSAAAAIESRSDAEHEIIDIGDDD